MFVTRVNLERLLSEHCSQKKIYVLPNPNNDMLYYNSPGSCTVLTSTEEFLQTQTCYCNSSSNYNFRHTFKINIRPQSLLHLGIIVCTVCHMCLTVFRICGIFILN